MRLLTLPCKKIAWTDATEALEKALERNLNRENAHPQRKLSTLKQILESKLVAEEAKREGFDQTPEMKEKLQYVIDDFLAHEYLRNIVLREIKVTEQDAKQYYDHS